MYDQYAESVRGAYFNFLPFYGPSREEVKKAGVQLSSIGEYTINRYKWFKDRLFGYFVMQTFQPHQVGLFLHDDPMAQLEWTADLLVHGECSVHLKMNHISEDCPRLHPGYGQPRRNQFDIRLSLHAHG